MEVVSSRLVATEVKYALAYPKKYLQSIEENNQGINMVSEKIMGRWKIDPGVLLCS